MVTTRTFWKHGSKAESFPSFLRHSLEGGRPEQHRESSLKYQTRCICAYPDGAGYALSSVEGRVAMEFFSDADQASTVHLRAWRVNLSHTAPNSVIRLRSFCPASVSFHVQSALRDMQCVLSYASCW